MTRGEEPRKMPLRRRPLLLLLLLMLLLLLLLLRRCPAQRKWAGC
jgi:hypothetical protein